MTKRNEEEMISKKVNIHVLVIAHPDDESMFFVPTISYLRSRQETVWLLCLSTGNYDGLGTVRREELNSVAALLDLQKLIVIDDPVNLPDHPTQAWPIEKAADEILRAIEKEWIKTTATSKCDKRSAHFNLITFDEDGVSGHSNHRDTFYAVRHLYLTKTKQQLERSLMCFDSISLDPKVEGTITAFSLKTIHNPIVKYLPLLEWVFLLCYWLSCVTGMSTSPCSASASGLINAASKEVFVRFHHPTKNWRAMKTHASQFVWYRRLFVVFSCYTYANVLQRIEVKATDRPKT